MPENVPCGCISSVSGLGLAELKDLIWEELNKESNKVIEISHRPLDVVRAVSDFHDELDENEEEIRTIYENEVDEEWDLSKYKGIGWDDPLEKES